MKYETTVDIKQIIDYHNNLYKNFVKEFFNEKYELLNPDATPKYFLLQAMGLKPDITKITYKTIEKDIDSTIEKDIDSNFASFIQSCGGGNCDVKIINENNEQFLTKIKNSNIKAIAHGHKPTCIPQPLIFKMNEIVFIANDTSNGNRPVQDDFNEISHLPLAYIEKVSEDELKYGVGTLNLHGNIENIDEKNIKKNDNKEYTILTDDYKKKLFFANGSLSVDELYNDEEINKIIVWDGFKPADLQGGKRKSKKHRYTKNKKPISKNHSNKRKKHRKSKKVCPHCKMH
jgi:hypothetical protein